MTTQQKFHMNTTLIKNVVELIPNKRRKEESVLADLAEQLGTTTVDELEEKVGVAA